MADKFDSCQKCPASIAAIMSTNAAKWNTGAVYAIWAKGPWESNGFLRFYDRYARLLMTAKDNNGARREDRFRFIRTKKSKFSSAHLRAPFTYDGIVIKRGHLHFFRLPSLLVRLTVLFAERRLDVVQ